MIYSTALWLVANYHLRFFKERSTTVTSKLILRKYLLVVCLTQTLFSSNRYDFECVEPGKQPWELLNYTLQMVKNECPFASKITLLSSDTIAVEQLTQDETNILFNFTHVDMCVRIFDSRFQHLSLSMKRLTGRCRGLLLDIISNNDLIIISVGEFVKHMKSDSIRIHGNPQLKKSQLIPFIGFTDIQADAECMLPYPLYDLYRIINCKRIYGVLSITSNVAGIKHIRDIIFTGCIQIKSSNATDLDLLEYFKCFTPIPYCHQYIADNMDLCVKNRTWIRATFGEDIEIYNNKPDCDLQCSGGVVTEQYLNATATCETRIGDVIIKDWKGKPKNVGVLYNTKYIEGRLIITGNAGLGNFDYFKNLEVVGTPMIAGSEPVLLVKHNTDLESLKMPKLRRVSQYEDDILIRVRDNAELELSGNEVNTFNAAAGGRDHTDIEENYLIHLRKYLPLLILILIIVTLLALFVTAMIVLAILMSKPSNKQQKVLHRQSSHKQPKVLHRQSSHKQPKVYHRRPSHKQLKDFHGQSQKEILADLCKEIVEKNPFVWMIQDRPLIWRYSADDFKGCGIKRLKKKHATFLQDHALKLLSNACIPSTSERCVLDRVCNVVKYEEVLIIGSDDDISLIIPSLPNKIGAKHTYKAKKSSITFKLQHIKYTDVETRRFIYAITVTQDGKLSKKKLRVFFYVWDFLRLPISFQELRRVVSLCSRRKMPCISDRRKEVFSLIHMIFTYVSVLQQPISVVEAFQLHTDTTNGAPMDRCEMLCVMAFILEWAHQTYSVPDEIEQKHLDWCHTYARMSNFYNDHPNIMIVHPENLITSRKSSLRDEIRNAGASAGESLSDRPREVISDKFRRRTALEMKAHPQEQTRRRTVSREEDGTTGNETGTTLPTLPWKANYSSRFKQERKIVEAMRKRKKTQRTHVTLPLMKNTRR